MGDDIRLDKDDITVEEIEANVCGECLARPATHVVCINFRGAGMAQSIGGNYCKDCAESIAYRIKDGLPAAGCVPS